ncbi:MAG: septum formation initiator family protein [Candidatus Dadabacteria bacterium]|nr:MAG: septum formation initiator family protein [Candidatus Dadabacteria bacterium]
MKRVIALVVLSIGLLATAHFIAGKEGLQKLELLRDALEKRRAYNAKLKKDVMKLRREIYNIQNDPRALEKVARERLGMARPNELIFLFEGDK